jgi:hypothetical protein
VALESERLSRFRRTINSSSRRRTRPSPPTLRKRNGASPQLSCRAYVSARAARPCGTARTSLSHATRIAIITLNCNNRDPLTRAILRRTTRLSPRAAPTIATRHFPARPPTPLRAVHASYAFPHCILRVIRGTAVRAHQSVFLTRNPSIGQPFPLDFSS